MYLQGIHLAAVPIEDFALVTDNPATFRQTERVSEYRRVTTEDKRRDMPASVNSGYLRSIKGILKILEVVAICVAFSCLADFDRNTNIWGDEYPQRFDFFMAVFVIALVIVLFVFFVFLLNLEGNITTERNWNILLLVFSGLFSLLFLISSSLMADLLRDLYDAKWNKIPRFKRPVEVLTVAVCFGFASAAFLVLDAAVAFKDVNT